MHNPITGFQRTVYDALLEIPFGRVTTYKLLADYIGCGSAQAVGQALRRNPFAPDVPCHRVIKSDLSIGGFQGESEGLTVQRKRELLKTEGVVFAAGKLSDKSLLLAL